MNRYVFNVVNNPECFQTSDGGAFSSAKAGPVNGMVAIVANTAGMSALASTFVSQFIANFATDVMPSKYQTRIKTFSLESDLDTFV